MWIYYEVKEHIVRLKSIELFESSNNSNISCPICASNLSENIPQIDEIKKSFELMESQIRPVEEASPNFKKLSLS